MTMGPSIVNFNFFSFGWLNLADLLNINKNQRLLTPAWNVHDGIDLLLVKQSA